MHLTSHLFADFFSNLFDKILGSLTKNDAFVVLVTPCSEKRPFVWFEIGFSWLRRLNRNCEIYAICAPPINPGKLPEPLCRLQAITLADEEKTTVFFEKLTKQFKLGNLDRLDFAKIRDSLPTYPSQITQSENIDISNEAKELLIEASKDTSGYILKMRHSGGTFIETNNKNMVPSQEARIIAKWEHALNELVENDFVEERGHKGEVFAVTHQGYAYVDTLKKETDVLQDKSSAENSESPQQDDLQFDQRSGIFTSEKTGSSYCTKCYHSSPSKSVQLQVQDNGWRCHACGKFYSNPNYHPPTHARNDYDPFNF